MIPSAMAQYFLIWLAAESPDPALIQALAVYQFHLRHLPEASTQALLESLQQDTAAILGVHIGRLPIGGWPEAWTESLLNLPALGSLSLDLPLPVVAQIRQGPLGRFCPANVPTGQAWLEAHLTQLRQWDYQKRYQQSIQQSYQPPWQRWTPIPPQSTEQSAEAAPLEDFSMLEPDHTGAVLDDQDSLEEAVAPPLHPQPGEILYHIPAQVGLDQPGKARVRLAFSDMRQRLTEGLTTDEQAEAVRVLDELSPVMTVSLVEYPAPRLFDIIPWNSHEQAILPGEVTEWIFGLAAKAAGQATLMLRITAKVHLPGYGERAHDLVVLNRPVTVAAVAPAEPPAFTPVPHLTQWGAGDSQAVRDALSTDDTARALSHLEAFLNHQSSLASLRDELILLQASWHRLQNDETLGLIRDEDAAIGRNRLHRSLLGLLRELEKTLATG